MALPSETPVTLESLIQWVWGAAMAIMGVAGYLLEKRWEKVEKKVEELQKTTVSKEDYEKHLDDEKDFKKEIREDLLRIFEQQAAVGAKIEGLGTSLGMKIDVLRTELNGAMAHVPRRKGDDD